MDTTLVGVTLLSMMMAASLSVIVWRMLRDERQRSEARVLALSRMAGGHQKPHDARGFQASPRDAVAGEYRELHHELPLHDAPVVTSTSLFTTPTHASPWGHRVAVMSGLGLVAASVILFALTAADRKAPARGVPAPAAQAPVAATAAGLELLSLRDTRQADSLTITGLVHNPRGGAALTRVTVTAYTFDDKGSFLASGRALIDVTALAPGDESPFVVSVPVTDAVARYRIGFRDESGRVIAHVDKRRQASVAALRPFDGLRVVPRNVEGQLGSGQANW
jgi:hypothetical protein